MKSKNLMPQHSSDPLFFSENYVSIFNLVYIKIFLIVAHSVPFTTYLSKLIKLRRWQTCMKTFSVITWVLAAKMINDLMMFMLFLWEPESLDSPAARWQPEQQVEAKVHAWIQITTPLFLKCIMHSARSFTRGVVMTYLTHFIFVYTVDQLCDSNIISTGKKYNKN